MEKFMKCLGNAGQDRGVSSNRLLLKHEGEQHVSGLLTFPKLSRCLAKVFLRTKTKTAICWFGDKTLATLVGVLNAFLPAPWGEAPQPWEHAVVLQPERMSRCWPQTWWLPVVLSNPTLWHALSKDQWLWQQFFILPLKDLLLRSSAWVTPTVYQRPVRLLLLPFTHLHQSWNFRGPRLGRLSAVGNNT